MQKVAGEIVVTKNAQGQIVAVTRQDEEGRILEVIDEAAPAAIGPAVRHDIAAHPAAVNQELLEALDRLFPLFERTMKGFVFTAEKAGQVTADMQAIRSAIARAKGQA